MRKLVIGLACVAAVTAGACKDALTTPDLNQPDIARSFGTPSTLSGLIATNFAQIHNGLMNTSTALDPQLMVAAFESYGTVANFSMALREGLPRTQVDNSRGNFSKDENFRDFQQMSRQARYATNYIQALDSLTKLGGHLSFPSGDAAADAINLKGEDLRAGHSHSSITASRWAGSPWSTIRRRSRRLRRGPTRRRRSAATRT